MSSGHFSPEWSLESGDDNAVCEEGGAGPTEHRPAPPLQRGAPTSGAAPRYGNIVSPAVLTSPALRLGAVKTETIEARVLAPADSTVVLLSPQTYGIVLVVGVDVVGVLVVPGGDGPGDAREVLQTVGWSCPAYPALDLSDSDVPAPLVVRGSQVDVNTGSEVKAWVSLQVEVLSSSQTTEHWRIVLACESL